MALFKSKPTQSSIEASPATAPGVSKETVETNYSIVEGDAVVPLGVLSVLFGTVGSLGMLGLDALLNFEAPLMYTGPLAFFCTGGLTMWHFLNFERRSWVALDLQHRYGISVADKLSIASMYRLRKEKRVAIPLKETEVPNGDKILEATLVLNRKGQHIEVAMKKNPMREWDEFIDNIGKLYSIRTYPAYRSKNEDWYSHY